MIESESFHELLQIHVPGPTNLKIAGFALRLVI